MADRIRIRRDLYLDCCMELGRMVDFKQSLCNSFNAYARNFQGNHSYRSICYTKSAFDRNKTLCDRGDSIFLHFASDSLQKLAQFTKHIVGHDEYFYALVAQFNKEQHSDLSDFHSF